MRVRYPGPLKMRAAVPQGKNAGVYRGRVAVRASGSFNITTSKGTTQGIAAWWYTLVQHRDGYQYYQRKEAEVPSVA